MNKLTPTLTALALAAAGAAEVEGEAGGGAEGLLREGAGRALEAGHFLAEERPEETARATRAFEATYALVERRVPRYFAWLTRSIRYVVPLATEPDSIISGSFHYRPAVVNLAYAASPLPLADFLAPHEAGHQYFYATRLVKRLDDGSDTQLYFQPLIRAQRKIDYMALGFHAHANVVLFCRDYRASGPDDDGYCARREASLLSDLACFQELLGTSKALTPVGRALVDPLLERPA